MKTLHRILKQVEAQEKRLLKERDKLNELLTALDFKCDEIDDACQSMAIARESLRNACDDMSKTR